MRLYGLSAFFQGEACVTDTLAPYVLAMPDEEMRIFLTTQLVDEARHTVFFARFFKEVLGVDKEKLEDALAVAREHMNAQLKYILIDSLVEVAERIRQEPGNLAHLVEGITLYHVVVEGTMALAGQRSILEAYRTNGLFPAFRGGFSSLGGDESRHGGFCVEVLCEMIQPGASYPGGLSYQWIVPCFSRRFYCRGARRIAARGLWREVLARDDPARCSLR